jgi:hypothetical protein
MLPVSARMPTLRMVSGIAVLLSALATAMTQQLSLLMASLSAPATLPGDQAQLVLVLVPVSISYLGRVWMITNFV